MIRYYGIHEKLMPRKKVSQGVIFRFIVFEICAKKANSKICDKDRRQGEKCGRESECSRSFVKICTPRSNLFKPNGKADVEERVCVEKLDEPSVGRVFRQPQQLR